MLASCLRPAGGARRLASTPAGQPLRTSCHRAQRLDRPARLSVAAAQQGGQAKGGRRAAAGEGASAAAGDGRAAPSSGRQLQWTGQQSKPAHLQGLSEEQLAAVTAPLGTVRVVAGPGSGKTRVLTHRIAHLMHAHGVQPWQVLAITFTNKAADEMKERLAGMLGTEAASRLYAGTFHSFCYRVLKRYISQLEGCGRGSDFAVYDQDMTSRLLRRIVEDAKPDWKTVDINQKARNLEFDIRAIKSRMLSWHAPSVQAVQQLVQEHLASRRSDLALTQAEIDEEQEVVAVFGRYKEALRQNNALDFDDLLGATVALLRSKPKLRYLFQRQFRHVCVDECQDLNTSQYELVKLLTLPWASLFVVGDPDQSIYGWRGADMTNMTDAIRKDYPRAQVYVLRDNYRSCAGIVATAAKVIAANEDWERAGLRAKVPAGQPIEVHVLPDSFREAEHVAGEIETVLCSQEHPLEQIAVLFRTHLQARLMEQELVRRSIPYVLMGGVPFWRRVEIQDVMAYLRLAVALRDDMALCRIMNTPKRGIGAKSVEKLQAAADAQGLALPALLFGNAGSASAAGSVGLPPLPDRKELGLPPKAAAAVEAFRELMHDLHTAVASHPLEHALRTIIDKTFYRQHVLEGGCGSSTSTKGGTESDRLERLDELLVAARDYVPGRLSGAVAFDQVGEPFIVLEPGAAAGGSEGRTPLEIAQHFLDEAALYSAVDAVEKGAPGVRLMTLHAAKGLEYELVFIPGCNEGQLPLQRGEDAAMETLREERRLFYVGITRARRRLVLSHTEKNYHFGAAFRQEQEPSRFLADVLSAGHAVVYGGSLGSWAEAGDDEDAVEEEGSEEEEEEEECCQSITFLRKPGGGSRTIVSYFTRSAGDSSSGSDD